MPQPNPDPDAIRQRIDELETELARLRQLLDQLTAGEQQ